MFYLQNSTRKKVPTRQLLSLWTSCGEGTGQGCLLRVIIPTLIILYHSFKDKSIFILKKIVNKFILEDRELSLKKIV
jgi:hypothetical protein